MEIKSVQLTEPDDLQKEMGATPGFLVTTDEDVMTIFVPADPGNRHYQEIRQWYEAQDEKPFLFDFGTPVETPDFNPDGEPDEHAPEPEEVPELPTEPLPETLLPPPDPNGEVLPGNPEEAERIQPPTNEPETFLPR